jgi:hypothetical protein
VDRLEQRDPVGSRIGPRRQQFRDRSGGVRPCHRGVDPIRSLEWIRKLFGQRRLVGITIASLLPPGRPVRGAEIVVFTDIAPAGIEGPR